MLPRPRGRAFDRGETAGAVRNVSTRALVVACACSLTTYGLGSHAVAATSTPTPFTVQGSVEQVAVRGATSGATARLLAADAMVVAKRRVDPSGSVLFRGVAPGTSYTVVIGSRRVTPVNVMAPTDTPPQSLYTSQHLADGFGY